MQCGNCDPFSPYANLDIIISLGLGFGRLPHWYSHCQTSSWMGGTGMHGRLGMRSGLYWLLIELREDGVHDPGGQENLPVRYRDGRIFSNRTVERFDQVLHS